MTQEEATKLVNKVFASQGQFMNAEPYNKTGSAEVAEDLVQEVFLARYRDLRMEKKSGKQRSGPLAPYGTKSGNYFETPPGTQRNSSQRRSWILFPRCLEHRTWRTNRTALVLSVGLS